MVFDFPFFFFFYDVNREMAVLCVEGALLGVINVTREVRIEFLICPLKCNFVSYSHRAKCSEI